MEDLTLAKSIKHLQEEKKFEMVLSEVGVSTVSEYFNADVKLEDNPFDTLLLTFYKGNVILISFPFLIFAVYRYLPNI